MTSVTLPARRVSAREIIDRAHMLVPGSRFSPNCYAGLRLRQLIVDGGLGSILEGERARFPRSDDPQSPVDCALYLLVSGASIERLGRELGTILASGRACRRKAALATGVKS